MIADYGARWGIKREGQLHQPIKVKKHGDQAKSIFLNLFFAHELCRLSN